MHRLWATPADPLRRLQRLPRPAGPHATQRGAATVSTVPTQGPTQATAETRAGTQAGPRARLRLRLHAAPDKRQGPSGLEVPNTEVGKGMIALIGDSLAVGIGAQSPAHIRVDAKVGRTSAETVQALRKAPEDRLWVSLGANDSDDSTLGLRVAIKYALHGRTCVGWVEPPRRPRQRKILREAARRDERLKVVSIHGVHRSDGVHPGPQGYRTLVQRLARSCPLKG